MEVVDDNFSYFSSKPYVVNPNLNRLIKTAQMKGYNICFYEELTKLILNYHQIHPLIYSSGTAILHLAFPHLSTVCIRANLNIKLNN